jgi:hypothetical protein
MSTADLDPTFARLIEAVTGGDLFDLAGGGPVDPAAMPDWDDGRTVPADLIRDILLGRTPATPDPRGLRLRGVRIKGRLDLDDVHTSVKLELFGCHLPDGLAARDASLPSLALVRCRLDNPAGPALDGARLRLASRLIVADSEVTGRSEFAGAVCLLGARIGGSVILEDSRFENPTGPAMNFEHAELEQSLFLRGATIVGASERGAVRLLGCHVGGSLECDRAQVTNDSGPALDAESVRVDHDVYLRRGFTATSKGAGGAVRLPGGTIGGSLNCEGATLSGGLGPALHAEALRVGQYLRFIHLDATGSGFGGAVRLLGSHVGISVSFDNAKIKNASGPAVNAERLDVEQSFFLRNVNAVGAGERGAVRLQGCHVGGSLECDGATLINDSGPAFDAEGIRVDHDAYLRKGLRALGAGPRGALRLPNAHIGGTLECTDATLRNTSGPALDASRFEASLGVLMRDCRVLGAGQRGAIRLDGAHIGRRWLFTWTRLRNISHPAALVSMDGLGYDGIPLGLPLGGWLRLLRTGMSPYAAQPYQQLAAAHRSAGHDRETRRILMEQRRQQIRTKTLSGTGARLWARLTGLTLGYGYQPWRALVGLLVVLAAAIVLCLSTGSGLQQTKNTASPGTNCTAVQRVGVAVDLALPLVKTSARNQCDVAGTRDGNRVAVLGWGLQLLSWAFATLFLAGFTGAVRKT